MTNPTLKTIIKLFSIFSNIESTTDLNNARSVVEFYLKTYAQVSGIQEFLTIFDFYNSQYRSSSSRHFFKEISLKSVKTLRTIDVINKDLKYDEKIYLLAHLGEILKTKDHVSLDEYDFLQTIGLSFNIPDSEFGDLKSFILHSCESIENQDRILIISAQQERPDGSSYKYIFRENLEGSLCFLYMPSTHFFLFYYSGNDTLFLNDAQIIPGKIYPFSKGSSISSYKMGLQNVKLKPVYYTELGMHFTPSITQRVTLTIKSPRFQYPKTQEGIFPFYFQSESFLFLGIIGSSGVGKSTLLNILNGNLKPQSGSVEINGFDVYQHKRQLKGIIGYVPQDDLLFESLTVYENLAYNARLCFSDYSSEEIRSVVEETMEELSLTSIRNSKVGSHLEQKISGGQRKRVNLALELMREPSLLLVDEPTSGLSSSDSVSIINLLREQTLKGKLVIVNIHQPSSHVFKLFDQLIALDQGGRPVYTGDPMEALVYFKNIDQQVNANEKECPVCGNINPEIILDILEEQEVDEMGNYTGKRKISPEHWYRLYRENIEKKPESQKASQELPQKSFSRPNLLKQFQIFFERNIKTKIANKQYMLISLLEAPLLALILGYFTKYTAGDASDPLAYYFSKNPNIPSYLLMSIIVVLFIGMLISAEEIIKDRKVLEREKFLDLGRSSYLLSKVMFLFSLSAFQVFSFVLIGNGILEIKGMTLNYWLILFSVSCFANMFGLLISDSFKSVVAIYILIPFLLIPQILLSGTIVQFDRLHGKLTNEIYPPFLGELMPSRWAYEALAVIQFKENKYQKALYPLEQKESDLSYIVNVWIPELMGYIDKCRTAVITSNREQSNLIDYILLLRKELSKLEDESGMQVPVRLNQMTNRTVSEHMLNQLNDYLGNLRLVFSDKLDRVLYRKDAQMDSLTNSLEPEYSLSELKNDYYNYTLAKHVKRSQSSEHIIRMDYQLIRKAEPIFQIPRQQNGRAPFYAPFKRLGNYIIDTRYFNVAIIWLFTFLLYLFLYYRIIDLFVRSLRSLYTYIRGKR